MPGYKMVKYRGKTHLKIGTLLFTMKEGQRAEARNKKYKKQKKKAKKGKK